MSARILVSAGESSGDRYAARLVEELRALLPDVDFFGCTGVEMRRAGVRTVVDTASLSVVGLIEVIHHIPRIYGEYRKMIAAADREKPLAAILTDSPDFHLRLAKQFHRRGIPVFYLVAPQAWAWREGRVKTIGRNVNELHCIFPFEEEFFRSRGVKAVYVGHPLSRLVRPSLSREQFFAKHGLPEDRPLITACPGSRQGEIARHLADVAGALQRIAAHREASFVIAAPKIAETFASGFFQSFTASTGARLILGETWDAMAHADVTLAASGTVTVEAALLGAPMVTYYRVTPVSWTLGKMLVHVPYYSMVNLVAGRQIVPELIQGDMTPENITAEALKLLGNRDESERMRADLAKVREALATTHDPLETSAARIASSLREMGTLS